MDRDGALYHSVREGFFMTEKQEPFGKASDGKPKLPEKIYVETVETWTPSESSERLYQRKFREFSEICTLRPMCIDYGVPCAVASCPLELYARLR